MKSVIKKKSYFIITHPDYHGVWVENFGDRTFYFKNGMVIVPPFQMVLLLMGMNIGKSPRTTSSRRRITFWSRNIMSRRLN